MYMSCIYIFYYLFFANTARHEASAQSIYLRTDENQVSFCAKPSSKEKKIGHYRRLGKVQSLLVAKHSYVFEHSANPKCGAAQPRLLL